MSHALRELLNVLVYSWDCFLTAQMEAMEQHRKEHRDALHKATATFHSAKASRQAKQIEEILLCEQRRDKHSIVENTAQNVRAGRWSTGKAKDETSYC